MRKLLISLGVAALAAGALTSCGDKGSSSASNEDKAFADTLATTLGEFAGAQQQSTFARMKANMSEEELAKFKKDDFLAGLRAVLESDTSRVAYYQGVQTGLQLLQPIMAVSQNYGYPVDPKVVYKAFKEVYEKDSLASADTYYAAYQEAYQKLQDRAREIEKKRLAESDDNKKNIEAGQEYAEKALKDGYTKAPSGIVYKIENAGTGAKVQPTDKVSIFYKGKKVDGTVFDETKDAPYTASASAFIPGFNEALTMLAKGGKMTVIIPGELAYGLEGAGNLIGPNETLVFDIEVADIQAGSLK
ncbi:MAG: FKBP-type peptidyl-prolyl cis-trans isomerase [Muribaculaceae bacterium]|nr:FKBP-type peptidyl-prolyl cis-trans isomerase [Muribaculaceae bacterium]MDE6360302.1 FKBP-type peptidyl-prolyl cis-trans isomerase [Muribaculaceae bacterium]